MSKARYLFSAAVFLPFLFFFSCKVSDPLPPPNVVLILSDDQGWGDLSMNGNRNLATPNIDSLAHGGVFFSRFYVSPVCSPTRAEMLTGRYHPRGGVYSTSAGGERLDLDEETIGEVFSSAGYRTAAFGKWHNGMQPPYHPNARGFEEFYGFCSGHWGDYFSPMLERNGELVEGKGFLIDDFTDNALQFMEDNREQPFFLYMPFNTPHGPMQVPDEWWNDFVGKELAQRHREPEKEDVQHTRAALAMCENIDWNVGRIIGKLKDLGLDENTIIVYFSDNGPNGWRWNEGMKGRKGSTDEGGVRSPLVISWKGTIQPERKVENISAAIDLLPTLTDLAGIEYRPRQPLDGVSLAPLLFEQEGFPNDRLIFSHWGDRTSARSQRYRLDQQGMLFDMVEDPGQSKDIAADEQEIAATLQAAIEDWKRDVLSELPAEDDRPFPVGHPDFSFTQLPARDAQAEGGVVRSNRFPNCSFYTNWKTLDDGISWDVEVLESGEFEATLYYTCAKGDEGSTFELSFGDSKLRGVIEEAWDPPLTGMENDRVERNNSYVKDFRPLDAGIISLEKGRGALSLKALDIPGSQVMDFRLLMLRRVGR